ncbi:hypothetical protein NIES4074_41550 [Cylindrospermum sp. NIES-4074]|nr:hypothetical protein NIES4074_41550 [Cylindrospermum sp. NIES-4074]
MTISMDNDNSSEHQLQPDILLWLSNLLEMEDPIAFLTKCQEAIQLSRQRQKEKAEAEAEDRRIAKAELEAKACNRLIAIILENAKSQGINPYDLPYLKRKSYDQLCTYIEECWPMLIPQI